MRAEVEKFANLMETRMKVGDLHRGDPEAYKKANRLQLKDALDRNLAHAKTKEDWADVANFAMMLAYHV